MLSWRGFAQRERPADTDGWRRAARGSWLALTRPPGQACSARWSAATPSRSRSRLSLRSSSTSNSGRRCAARQADQRGPDALAGAERTQRALDDREWEPVLDQQRGQVGERRIRRGRMQAIQSAAPWSAAGGGSPCRRSGPVLRAARAAAWSFQRRWDRPLASHGDRMSCRGPRATAASRCGRASTRNPRRWFRRQADVVRGATRWFQSWCPAWLLSANERCSARPLVM